MKITNLGGSQTPLLLKTNDIFYLARSLHCMLRGPMVGSTRQKREMPNVDIFTPGRETATAFAAAFITALLFVSSATSLLPVA